MQVTAPRFQLLAATCEQISHGTDASSIQAETSNTVELEPRCVFSDGTEPPSNDAAVSAVGDPTVLSRKINMSGAWRTATKSNHKNKQNVNIFRWRS